MRNRLFLLFVAAACSLATIAQNLTQYVDPMIGTGDHGHVFVGANVPQGMVNVGPTQIETGWDWCSGYHQSGDSIVGFAQMHLSGTGCSDLGDIALMPTMGDVELSRQGLASAYRHETEEAHPGYYRVVLDKWNILAEMTATERVALHRYTYPRGSNNARIIVDLNNGIGDRMRQARVYQIDASTLAGFRISHGWANRQEVYFIIQFSKPIHHWVCDSLGSPYGIATFEVGPGEAVMAKVALSPVSEMNAQQNMVVEMPGWDFKAVCKAADETWNEELARIRATFRNDRDKRIFYTSMYHMMVAPSIWNDLNGDYMGSDGRVYRAANFTNYTTWSLWDTYRAAHPLATLILRDRLTDYAQSMLKIYEQQGELPVWHLMSNETYCMVGCPGVSVLADMCLKGVQGFDLHEAYKAMKESLLKDNRSLHWMKELGYVPYNRGDGESVAKSLEYYIADWSAAEVAGKLGLTDDSIYFHNRSMGYKRLFDSKWRCMRALDSEGRFEDDANFNPSHQTRPYTEGNPWQYTWLVPHDVHGLVSCFPSEEAFISRLDSLFLVSSDLNAEANPDITGLIGQYAHGNEPSHHTLYLYNYVGQPWKTAAKVRQVMSELYTDQPAGLCGNEDVGQMSAWYILSSMGLYQVEPCGGRYIIGSPLVESAEINVGNGKSFSIVTHNNNEENIYVERVKLNGRPYPYSYICYDDIVAGGTLEFYMSKTPGKWGTDPKYRP